jgi:hypothetical protein
MSIAIIVARTAVALIFRSARLSTALAAFLMVVWYVLYGTYQMEYVVLVSAAFATISTAVAMLIEFFLLVAAEKAFKTAKSAAYRSGHYWQYRKAADLAVPLCVAFGRIDFGVVSWNSSNAVLVDNVRREARELRQLANRNR